MWNMNDATAIEYQHDHVFKIVFDPCRQDRLLGIHWSGTRDETFFRAATNEGGTTAWPNGADIAPETLYEKLEHAYDAFSPDRINRSTMIRRSRTIVKQQRKILI